MAGPALIPLVQLAVTHNVHAEFASQLVTMLDQERIYFADEHFDFPRNVPHVILGATGSEKARILRQIRPALGSETILRPFMDWSRMAR